MKILISLVGLVFIFSSCFKVTKISNELFIYSKKNQSFLVKKITNKFEVFNNNLFVDSNKLISNTKIIINKHDEILYENFIIETTSLLYSNFNCSSQAQKNLIFPDSLNSNECKTFTINSSAPILVSFNYKNLMSNGMYDCFLNNDTSLKMKNGYQYDIYEFCNWNYKKFKHSNLRLWFNYRLNFIKNKQ